MSIYTRKGDEGRTTLLGGSQVDKDAPRVEASGTLDELNAVLGVALVYATDPRTRETIPSLQQDLLTAGSDLACPDPSRPDVPRLSEAHWRRLEDMIDGFEGDLPRLTNFVLPGGSPGGAWLHLARTVCRRAERVLAKAMKREGGISPALLAYPNRLSDLLFVMARFETQAAGKAETTWRAQP